MPATRSRSPCRPVPFDASAPPWPLSRISTTSRSADRAIDDVGPGRAAVAGDVGQRLGDDEVGRALDGRRAGARRSGRRARPARRPGHDRGQRGVDPAVLEDHRMDAAHEIADLAQAGYRSAPGCCLRLPCRYSSTASPGLFAMRVWIVCPCFFDTAPFSRVREEATTALLRPRSRGSVDVCAG